MSRFEITQGVWEKIMGDNPSRFKKGDNYPVEQVSWNQAQKFMKKLTVEGGYTPRLPTEAEWEYSARGGGRKELYSGGNDPSVLGWYEKNNGGSTHPVGQKIPNAYGLYDMSGNVWEWCQDLYSTDSFIKKPENSPDNKGISLFRVRRGGSWDLSHRYIRSIFRGRYPADLNFESNGFRVVLEAE